MSDDYVSKSREEQQMTSHHGTHNDLHSEQGALPAEHPGPDALHELVSMARSLREENEFDLTRLRGLLKVTSS